MATQVKKVAPKLDAKTQAGLDAQTTVSGKIRYLAKAGMSRADIARTLGKLYQHVKNVLDADAQRKVNKG